MGRLLDENDVVDALEKVASFFPYRIPGKGETYDKYNEAWNDAIGRAEMEIKQLPPAQPEHKKGEWIVYKAPDKQHCGLVKCPFCGEDMIAEADEYNFCPNCGADMRQSNAD